MNATNRTKNPLLLDKLKKGELKFDYINTGCHFQAHYKNGEWNEGRWMKEDTIELHQGSQCLHYAQQCFEGMKAYENKSGNIMLFRPSENWKRMKGTAERLMLACPPEDFFLETIRKIVHRNWEYLPPHGSGASLYIRPLLIGCGENLGLNPAKECIFRVFVSPVGNYFSGSCAKLIVTPEDRSAPKGTGRFKAGSNYASGFLLAKQTREQGGTEVLYLDAKEHRYLDEAGSANIIVHFEDGTVATPDSPSILPSITRRSVLEIAEKLLGLKTECRKIRIEELANATEVGLTGTAAIISVVGEVLHQEKSYRFHDQGKSWGPVMTDLFNKLRGIQMGDLEDSFGWTEEITV